MTQTQKNGVGGDLGFQPANLSPEIRKAVESLEVGVYSGPVATVSDFIFSLCDKQQSQLNEKKKNR